MYLEKCKFDEEKSAKIYKSIETLLHKVSIKTEEDEDNED
jgi:hypothetical protein